MTRNIDLDILRAYAIIGTFLAHLPNFANVPNSISPIFNALGWGMGVDIFFVLSGYLITNSLIHTKAVSASGALKIFWIKRFWRIVPTSFVWIVAASLISILFAHHNDKSGIMGTLWSALAAVFNYANVYWSFCIQGGLVGKTCGGGANMAVWWSLALEEQFYLFFPLIFLFFRKQIVLVFAASIIVYFVFNPRFFANIHWMMRADGLAAGVILAFIMNSKAYSKRLKLQSGVMAKMIGHACLLGVFIAGGLAYRVPDLNPLFFSLAVLLAALCIFIASQNVGAYQLPVLKHILNWIGLISFSFYLSHESVLVLSEQLANYIMPLNKNVKFLFVATSSFAFSMLFASLSYRWLEGPLMKLGSRQARSPQTFSPASF